ncbi:MAG: Gfo/Idh/MocA family oxidoreductase [Gemmataceae bacterium]
MSSPLRIGVVGLGRRWPRYRQALLALSREARAVAVHDPALERAETEARELGCEAAAGAVELIERPDVDAVLVPGGAWHGLWAVERAARAGKPVLCAASPVEDEECLDAIPPDGVHVALWPALTLAREALSERLRESLGRPLFAQATWTRHGDRDLLATAGALALFRACADLFGEAPRTVAALPAPSAVDCASLLLSFDEQRLAQLTLWGGPAARPGLTVQVEAEGGPARLELPRRVEWQDAEGRHALQLPGGLAEGLVLDRFVRAVRDGEPPACGLAAAGAALGWLRAARRARETGQPVALGPAAGRA